MSEVKTAARSDQNPATASKSSVEDDGDDEDDDAFGLNGEKTGSEPSKRPVKGSGSGDQTGSGVVGEGGGQRRRRRRPGMGIGNLTREEQLRQRRRNRGNVTEELRADSALRAGGTLGSRGKPDAANTNATSSATTPAAAASSNGVLSIPSNSAAGVVAASADPLVGDPPDEGSIKASDVM